ncbi:helix-turn-helix domain-containing protein [Paraburkholderia sp. GAS348]|uniref:helix-turn-helix domain-containing protein n=1 Tax=Paraburkholderia sp. GAS348 TaxID=3035132 RepID=UPI003D1EE93F
MIGEWELHLAMKAARVPSSTRHVLRTLRMREMMNPDGKAAWPSYQTIADDIGASRRTVIDAIKWCAEQGWLKVMKRPLTAGNNDTNEYRLLIPQIVDSAPGCGDSGAMAAPPLVQSSPPPSAMVAPKQGIEEGRLKKEGLKTLVPNPKKLDLPTVIKPDYEPMTEQEIIDTKLPLDDTMRAWAIRDDILDIEEKRDAFVDAFGVDWIAGADNPIGALRLFAGTEQDKDDRRSGRKRNKMKGAQQSEDRSAISF